MRRTALLVFLILSFPGVSSSGQLPEFPLGTVLVWNAANQGYTYNFVIRLAKFRPDLYFEWENKTTQGTVLIKRDALEGSRKYVSQKLFQAGAEIESNGETSYWISREVYRDLKEKKKANITLDALKTKFEVVGEGEYTFLLNEEPQTVTVIELKDGRSGRWWILDNPENPLVLKRQLRTFTEQLDSITTDPPGSLRWIKGKRLKRVQPWQELSKVESKE